MHFFESGTGTTCAAEKDTDATSQEMVLRVKNKD